MGISVTIVLTLALMSGIVLAGGLYVMALSYERKHLMDDWK